MQTDAIRGPGARPAQLVLWRLLPPFRKTVDVYPITVGGWLTIVKAVAQKVAAIRVAVGRDITEADVMAHLGDGRELSLFADLVCPGERPGFFLRWLGGYWMAPLTRRNVAALVAASQAAENAAAGLTDGGWTRILGTLNLAPPAGAAAAEGKKTKGRGRGQKPAGGGLMADVRDVARFYALDPSVILDGWTMHRFLDVCDSLLLAAEQAARDRAAEEGGLSGLAFLDDDELEPDPVEDFARMGSGRVVH